MGQMIGAPLDVTCPACQSRPGAACTRPTDTGRQQVLWYHLARETAYNDAKARGELN